MHLETRIDRADVRLMNRQRTRSKQRASRATARPRRGFALPELIVAMVMMSVGILALASTAAGVMKQMRSGNQRALAAVVAQSRLERLRSVQCSNLSTNSATTRGLNERWTIGALMAGGRAIAVKESVSYVPRAGKTSALVITGLVPCI
jgi:prepilin-type N-terminal cleavage/methylation domain-containing protein